MTSGAPDDPAPTESLVAGTVGDRCVNCGTPLTSDQRYCVVCGERRGAPRFTLPASAKETRTVTSVERPPRRRPPRISSGATLVAGVGTLLLAMGVGVLIGRGVGGNGNARTVAAASPQVITVNGGGGSGGGSSSGGSSAGSGGGAATTKKPAARHSSSHKAVKHKVVVIDKKQAAAESNAAAKVLGASSKNTPPPTVTVGQKGSGAGYNKKTGKFDGSFFGQ